MLRALLKVCKFLNFLQNHNFCARIPFVGARAPTGRFYDALYIGNEMFAKCTKEWVHFHEHNDGFHEHEDSEVSDWHLTISGRYSWCSNFIFKGLFYFRVGLAQKTRYWKFGSVSNAYHNTFQLQ